MKGTAVAVLDMTSLCPWCRVCVHCWTGHIMLFFCLVFTITNPKQKGQIRPNNRLTQRQGRQHEAKIAAGQWGLATALVGTVLAKRGRMLLLPVKGCSVRSSVLLSLPVYTRMESFPLQLTLVSADRHPSRLTLTALLDTAAKLTTGPRANLTSLMQPPKPAEQHRRGWKRDKDRKRDKERKMFESHSELVWFIWNNKNCQWTPDRLSTWTFFSVMSFWNHDSI